MRVASKARAGASAVIASGSTRVAVHDSRFLRGGGGGGGGLVPVRYPRISGIGMPARHRLLGQAGARGQQGRCQRDSTWGTRDGVIWVTNGCRGRIRAHSWLWRQRLGRKRPARQYHGDRPDGVPQRGTPAGLPGRTAVLRAAARGSGRLSHGTPGRQWRRQGAQCQVHVFDRHRSRAHRLVAHEAVIRGAADLSLSVRHAPAALPRASPPPVVPRSVRPAARGMRCRCRVGPISTSRPRCNTLPAARMPALCCSKRSIGA